MSQFELNKTLRSEQDVKALVEEYGYIGKKETKPAQGYSAFPLGKS